MSRKRRRPRVWNHTPDVYSEFLIADNVRPMIGCLAPDLACVAIEGPAVELFAQRAKSSFILHFDVPDSFENVVVELNRRFACHRLRRDSACSPPYPHPADSKDSTRHTATMETDWVPPPQINSIHDGGVFAQLQNSVMSKANEQDSPFHTYTSSAFSLESDWEGRAAPDLLYSTFSTEGEATTGRGGFRFFMLLYAPYTAEDLCCVHVLHVDRRSDGPSELPKLFKELKNVSLTLLCTIRYLTETMAVLHDEVILVDFNDISSVEELNDLLITHGLADRVINVLRLLRDGGPEERDEEMMAGMEGEQERKMIALLTASSLCSNERPFVGKINDSCPWVGDRTPPFLPLGNDVAELYDQAAARRSSTTYLIAKSIVHRMLHQIAVNELVEIRKHQLSEWKSKREASLACYSQVILALSERREQITRNHESTLKLLLDYWHQQDADLMREEREGHDAQRRATLDGLHAEKRHLMLEVDQREADMQAGMEGLRRLEKLHLPQDSWVLRLLDEGGQGFFYSSTLRTYLRHTPRCSGTAAAVQELLSMLGKQSTVRSYGSSIVPYIVDQ